MNLVPKKQTDNLGTFWSIPNKDHVSIKYHREDGPACIDHNGDQSWYKDGLRHRIDGPAILFARINMPVWYLNGIEWYDSQRT